MFLTWALKELSLCCEGNREQGFVFNVHWALFSILWMSKIFFFFCHPLVPPNCCASTQVQLWCSYSAVAEWWRKNMMVYYFHRIFKWFETLYMKLGYEMLLCSFCSTVGFDFYYTVKVVSALSVYDENYSFVFCSKEDI